MERGYELLKTEKYFPALLHFLHFANITPVTEEVVSAMHISGFVLIQIRQFENALEYLLRASEEVEKFDNPELKEKITQDLDATKQKLRL
jgi:DNA integrity scanning protein DisA with diadenylate cyclase activity